MSDKFYENYIEYHYHPNISELIEVVIYERIDNRFDVYLFEELNSIPELEVLRTDQFHLFVGTINQEDEFNELYIRKIKSEIGDKYDRIPYFKENKSKKFCSKIYDELKKAGCFHMSIQATGSENYIIYIRRKDIELAECIIKSNLS